ncbi:MAG: hypothetical protein K5644_02065 [Lachnospiraceae bacterium]|nr:hypothetical protein [Lachnospiraceae bacterium]
MSKSYEEFVNQIMNMRRFGNKTGVEVSTELLDAFDHPEKGMKIIHVAGTNGKGSSCVFMANVLMKMGLKVGLFTSPHLMDFNERIQVAQDNTFTRISHEEVIQIGQKILDKEIEASPTMFDICFMMAILKFKKEQCDYVILETGLGGIYDSTTAIACIPKVCLITSIGMDHTQYLGNSIEEVARNKAGIFVKGSIIILSDMEREALRVMKDRYMELGIEDRDVLYVSDLDDKPYTYIKMLPGYQKANAKAAIVSIKALVDGDKDTFIIKYMEYCKSKEEHCSNDCAHCHEASDMCSISLDDWVDLCINMGISGFSHPGRLEKLSKNVIMDGAHNEEAFTALRSYIDSEYGSYKVHMIIGVLSDKEYQKGLDIIGPAIDSFMTADVADSRAKSGKELALELTEEGYNAKYLGDEREVALYIEELMKKNNANSSSKLYNNLYVITGSLYFVGNVKRILWQLQQEQKP